ncbi:MAG: lamin tail domain-containing protein [Saprospiraceae bacterium]|nr:lamin tail domain-containing protein [Saprospiraceae bacterium]
MWITHSGYEGLGMRDEAAGISSLIPNPSYLFHTLLRKTDKDMQFLRFSKFLVGAMLVFLAAISANAQFSDNFSDGDFTANPAWQGDMAEFKVNTALELQLNGPDAGTSWLYLPTAIADSAVWELYFRMEFDPSNSNRLTIVLQSDSPNLATASGYYLQIGADGTADAIQFYRQDAGVSTLLATATAAGVASSPNVRLRMTRQVGGNWTLETDYDGGPNLTQELQVVDATYGAGDAYFGFFCLYTATRKDKFFFDDIQVQPLTPDTTPPVLLSATPVSATEVEVRFDENLDEITATDPANFNLDQGIGQPAAAFLDGLDKTLVHLSLASPLQNLTDYVLTINGIADLEGNLAASQSASFSYIEVAEAVEYDVLINEIMADPSPAVALPNVEYIELYNRSNKVLDLSGWGFSSGSAPQIFPAYQMLPGSYLIVCDDSKLDSLAAFGNVLGLGTFPALTNDGDDIILTDANGTVIHAVNYKIDWYGDAGKEEGGWSLELVSPLAPCRGAANWRASVNLLGGTPGQPNSVLDPQPDEVAPILTQVFANQTRPLEIQFFFDERLDPASALNPANYSVSGGLSVVSANFLQGFTFAVVVQLSGPLQPSVFYEVTVQDVADCSGNALAGPLTESFALPESIEPNDLIINEILFNPYTGGSDFVEVYNRSQKVLNLADLIIGNLQLGVDTTTTAVINDHLIFPGEYVVFTESPSDLQSRYTVQDANALIANDLPSFNDDAGNVTLFRVGQFGEAVFIDAFDYSEDLHHPLLDEVDGVSLERLHPDGTTQDPANWHSAAKGAGWATPTYRNSQFFENQAIGDDFFEIPEKTLSPDDDGYQDFLIINYKTDKPGYAAKVRIFDSEGRFVKSIANNELLATEGFLRWDGDTDDGAKARIGIYVLTMELFTPDGTVKEAKKTCVVAGKL